MKNNLEKRLLSFRNDKKITSKGSLSVVVQITRSVKNRSFPMSYKDFTTAKEGQVAGLGGANLKNILADYGITRILSSEGGRTSRGSMKLMKDYIDFLNELYEFNILDVKKIEEFWIKCVKEFFESKPLTIKYDTSLSLSHIFQELFDQAKSRQQENKGTQYLGMVLQHLVAAKLCTLMPNVDMKLHGACVADQQLERNGDFQVGDTVIHCTTMPSEALLYKCVDNLGKNLHPLIITIAARVKNAIDIAEDMGFANRIEVWDIQQFLATNINEHSLFRSSDRNFALQRIIDKYNEIIESFETDRSLMIEFKGDK